MPKVLTSLPLLRHRRSADSLGAAGVGVWDCAGCTRMDPGRRVRRHRCGNQDAGRDTLPGWGCDGRPWGLPSSRCCDWHVEAHRCRVYVEDCALGLAGQSGTGRGGRWARTDRSSPGPADHLSKWLGGRSTGHPALLGRGRPSHLWQTSRSRRGAERGHVLIGFSCKGTRRRAPVARDLYWEALVSPAKDSGRQS